MDQCTKMSALLLVSIASFLINGVSADFFVYKENDGTTWYTDHKLPGDRYTLITTIGRPSASGSCAKMTPSKLEARASLYLPIIKKYASLYDIDYRLIKAIISVESCFDSYAVSRVGAKGLMQLMPATANQLGVYNIFNAKENIRGGIRYFSKMMVRFDQDTKLALAAYNAGPKAVEKYGGVPPYKETQHYIKRVMKYYQKYGKAGDSKPGYTTKNPG